MKNQTLSVSVDDLTRNTNENQIDCICAGIFASKENEAKSFSVLVAGATDKENNCLCSLRLSQGFEKYGKTCVVNFFPWHELEGLRNEFEKKTNITIFDKSKEPLKYAVSGEAKAFVAKLKEDFQIIVVAGNFLQSHDGEKLTEAVDGVVLNVVDCVTDLEKLIKIVDVLQMKGIKIIGSVLSKM